MSTEQYCLKWNNYQLSLTSAFKHILEEEDFVDVTLSAQGQSLKAHKVVLSACSTYFKELLRGISLWQHPVLVLKDVPFSDLQSILEFVYLGEVNVEQGRLQSFLKTADVMQIKGLTDGLNNPTGIKDVKAAEERNEPDPPDIKPDMNTYRKRSIDPSSALEAEEKRLKFYDQDDSVNDSMVIDDSPIDDEDCNSSGFTDGNSSISSYSGEHIIVAGDPAISSFPSNLPLPPPGVKEDLGPLHKRCPVCHMVMLKKNLSRHVRDQHTVERPRSICPICQKTYKTQDWLKDHIRRGHNYTKEETDELMAKIKLDANMNGGDALLSPPAGLAISPALPTVSAV